MTFSIKARSEYRPGIETDHRVPTSDGLILATDIYLPTDPPRVVVVTRTPYDRARLRRDGLGWAAAGIAFVAQDVRGRYGSDGAWSPYHDERLDGAATLAWVRDQEWGADAALIVLGASYAAYTAWAMAVTVPDTVAGVISAVPAAGTRAINYTESGILRLAEHAMWWGEHAESRTSRTDVMRPMLADGTMLRHLPVSAIGKCLGVQVPRWWSVVAGGPSQDHPADDGPEAVTDDEMASIGVPTLHIGGWYDDFLPQTLHQWKVTGAARDPRPGRQLLIGPWAHALSSPHESQVGGRTHALTSRLPLGRYQVEWVRALVEGAVTSGEDVYLPGTEGWLHSWPPQTRQTTLYAHSNACLSASEPSSTSTWSDYQYDPRDPFPSSLAAVDIAMSLDSRRDRIKVRHRLSTSMTIVGRMCATIRTRSDRPGDRTVCIAERRADGAVIALAADTVPVAAGEHVATVILPVTAATVPATSELEMIVTGGAFPAVTRHPQSDDDRYTATCLHTAVHRIALDDQDTRLTIPVADRLPAIHDGVQTHSSEFQKEPTR